VTPEGVISPPRLVASRRIPRRAVALDEWDVGGEAGHAFVHIVDGRIGHPISRPAPIAIHDEEISGDEAFEAILIEILILIYHRY
jgi:hypothetical protein